MFKRVPRSETAIYPCVDRRFGGYGDSIQVDGIWGVYLAADFSFFRRFYEARILRFVWSTPLRNQAQLV